MWKAEAGLQLSSRKGRGCVQLLQKAECGVQLPLQCMWKPEVCMQVSAH
jgi:hypothetical protein